MLSYFENRKTIQFDVLCLNFCIEMKIKSVFLISIISIYQHKRKRNGTLVQWRRSVIGKKAKNLKKNTTNFFNNYHQSLFSLPLVFFFVYGFIIFYYFYYFYYFIYNLLFFFFFFLLKTNVVAQHYQKPISIKIQARYYYYSFYANGNETLCQSVTYKTSQV